MVSHKNVETLVAFSDTNSDDNYTETLRFQVASLKVSNRFGAGYWKHRPDGSHWCCDSWGTRPQCLSIIWNNNNIVFDTGQKHLRGGEDPSKGGSGWQEVEIEGRVVQSIFFRIQIWFVKNNYIYCYFIHTTGWKVSISSRKTLWVGVRSRKTEQEMGFDHHSHKHVLWVLIQVFWSVWNRSSSCILLLGFLLSFNEMFASVSATDWSTAWKTIVAECFFNVIVDFVVY